MRLKCCVVREELEHSKEICNRTVLDLFSKGHLVSRLGESPGESPRGLGSCVCPRRESARTWVLCVSPERVLLLNRTLQNSDDATRSPPLPALSHNAQKG